MGIDLEKEAMESIVKDGVKEIMKQVVGSSQGAKKAGWFQTVKVAVKDYQQRIKEDFLPVIINDFSQHIVVKFSGGKMSKEDIEKLKMFMEMVEKSNLKQVQKDLVKKVDDLKANAWKDDFKERLDAVKKMLEDGHQWIMRRLELYIRSVACDTMFRKTVERSKMEVMLYNFVDGEVPENVKKLLENGMNSVPSIRLSKKETDRRVQEALLDYLLRLGRRSISGHAVMHASSVQDWLRQIKILNIDKESREFVETLEACLPSLQAELDLVYTDLKLDSKEEIVSKLEKEGCVLVACDKNMGMSLFRLETMRKADEALMNQLGAEKMDCSKEKIIREVQAEIEKFEEKLTCEQKEYMDAAYNSRQSERSKVSFPFLKSHHKIHKMNEEQIQRKDLSVLKFRPVVDAKQWLTKGYAGVVMQMMRGASNRLIQSGGSVIRKLKVQNGWRFAVELQDYAIEEEYDVMVTADIQEAYTNITDVMIKKAIVIVGRNLGYEEWEIDLMKKLIDLVLGQNFAETSGGLFKFKKVLPMGYKLSGDALDIVALAEELTVLFNLGEGSLKSRFRIGELKSYPDSLVDINVQNEVSMSKGVKSFTRYVDDTHTQIAGTKEQVLNGILAVGYMYPQSLVISMELNIWQSSFLDVFAWKNIFAGTVSTMVRRNGEVPVGHIRRNSSHPEKYKLQSLLGEMLRGRRIASDEGITEITDKCIAHEFESIGYSRREVEDAMLEAENKVKANYSGMFVKINEDDERRYYSYGGGLIYNKNYKYGEVLMDFINKIKPHGEPGIVLLPDVKIKRLAYTKKRYLELQEEDKNKYRA